MDSNNMYQNQSTDSMDQQPAYNYGGNYNNGGVYAQPAYQSEMEEPVSVGEWIITMLIMMVPCVNIVMMFVWAFGSSAKRSKSNYFKAGLIMAGIVFALYLILVIFAVIVGVSLS